MLGGAFTVQQMAAFLQMTRVLTRLLLFLVVLPLQLQKEAKMLPLWSRQVRYVTLISLALVLWEIFCPM